jgi:hypothetical protein
VPSSAHLIRSPVHSMLLRISFSLVARWWRVKLISVMVAVRYYRASKELARPSLPEQTCCGPASPWSSHHKEGVSIATKKKRSIR